MLCRPERIWGGKYSAVEWHNTNRQTELVNARLVTTSMRALSPARLIDFDRLVDEVAVTNYGGDCHNYALLPPVILIL